MLEFELYSRSDEESSKLVLFLFVCSKKIHLTYWGEYESGGGETREGRWCWAGRQRGRRDGKRLWEQRVDGDL